MSGWRIAQIRLNADYTTYKDLFPKRSRIVTVLVWEEIQNLSTNSNVKTFIENTFLSIIPSCKFKDYRSKSQDLHCPPIKLRETNILNILIKQFNKRLRSLYDYDINNYSNLTYSELDYREHIQSLAPESIDLFITDPPWHDGNAYFERAQLYHPWIDINLKTNKALLSKEMVVSDSPERPDKRDKDQWWADINDLFKHSYTALKTHHFLVLYFRPIPADQWIVNFNRLKLLARKNGFEPLLCIDIANNDPAMRIQQSAHYAFSSDLILTFIKLNNDEKRIYYDDIDLDELAFKVAVTLQDKAAGTFTRQDWFAEMHLAAKGIGLLTLHLPKNQNDLTRSFERVCEEVSPGNFLPKPSTPYSNEIFNTPYIERVSLYIPYIIEELLTGQTKFTFDQFLLKVAEFVENGTREIIEDILEDGENSIHSLLNIYAEPLEGGQYFTQRPIPEIPENILNILQLDPYEFEAFSAKLLELEGYTNVVLAGRSGDRGVDIRCNDKNGDLVIVQCKRYTKTNIGSTPIQRLHSFALTRGAKKMICITTTDFTRDGKDEANKTGVETINRDGLELLVHKHGLF